MEQLLALLPLKEILASPNSAWALIFIVMLVFTMWQNSKREDGYIGIVEGTLKEITGTLSLMAKDVSEVKKEIEDIRRGDVD